MSSKVKYDPTMSFSEVEQYLLERRLKVSPEDLMDLVYKAYDEGYDDGYNNTLFRELK